MNANETNKTRIHNGPICPLAKARGEVAADEMLAFVERVNVHITGLKIDQSMFLGLATAWAIAKSGERERNADTNTDSSTQG